MTEDVPCRTGSTGTLPPELRRRLARLLVEGGADDAPGLLEAGWTDRGGALISDRVLMLGVDVGGTKIHTALADLEGRILAEERTPTARSSGEAILCQIEEQRRAVLRQAEVAEDRIAAAGIGLPGSVHPEHGRLYRAPNIVGLEGRDLRTELAERLELPVAVENDVNLAALGEAWRSGAPESLVFIALGTGIGMGTVLDGRLVRGAMGAAGEIAWLPIGANPFDPAVHESGALESAISSAALVRDYLARGGTTNGSLRDLFDRAGDPALEATLDGLADLLARAILAVQAVLDPDRVVLGGSVGSRSEVLLRVRELLSRVAVHPPRCEVSSLGNRAGVIGAVRAARTALAATLAPASLPRG